MDEVRKILTRFADASRSYAGSDFAGDDYCDLMQTIKVGDLRAAARALATPQATHTKPTLNPLTGGWIKLADRIPISEFDGERVLIYTEGYDFAGQQVFDVLADHLNECFFEDPEEQMPEVCQAASHWMPRSTPS